MDSTLTIEGVSQVDDEMAYSIIIQATFQMFMKGHVEMAEEHTFGHVVDRRLHNFAAPIHQLAASTGISVNQAAELLEQRFREDQSQPETQRAGALLQLKAWRYRRSEGDF